MVAYTYRVENGTSDRVRLAAVRSLQASCMPARTVIGSLDSSGPLLVYCSQGSSFFVLFTTGLLPLGSSELAGSLARGGGERDELFTGASNEERGDVDHLFADSDVSLSDEDASLMYGSSEVSLDNEGLESTFHELVDGQTEHVIELALVLVEETKSDHALDEGITY